jgi:hypothetical protein
MRLKTHAAAQSLQTATERCARPSRLAGHNAHAHKKQNSQAVHDSIRRSTADGDRQHTTRSASSYAAAFGSLAVWLVPRFRLETHSQTLAKRQNNAGSGGSDASAQSSRQSPRDTLSPAAGAEQDRAGTVEDWQRDRHVNGEAEASCDWRGPTGAKPPSTHAQQFVNETEPTTIMAMRQCGNAAMRQCGNAAMRQCGNAAMRQCGNGNHK